jgi:NAD(P)-dependent dehydrogenase (short-subunit alcohol dehydrogenase family)
MAQSTSMFTVTPEKEASKLDFLRRQFLGGAPPLARDDVDLSGKTAVVTGANGGLGLECARQLLDLGVDTLIMAVRNTGKGEEAVRRLKVGKALKPGQTIQVWELDYASYESIQAFTERVEALNPRLDIAILNAGVNRGRFATNPSTGHEEDIQTNYLSTALLTLLLLRAFQKAASSRTQPKPPPGRIVIVSSDTAAWSPFHERKLDPLLPAFDDAKNWDKLVSYGTTKLLGQLFTVELAKRVPPSLAIINCANPGLCYGSGLAQELGTFTAVFIRIVGRAPSLGARAILHAAVKQDETSHGHYVEDGEIRP